MAVRKSTFAIIFLALLTQSSIFADRIYLKSGKVLQGKIMSRRQSFNPAPAYCFDFNDTVVLTDNNDGTYTYNCVPPDDILRVEREFKKPEGLALLAEEDKWGTQRYGYVTQLIPQSQDYIIGKPMNFGLVLMNVSDSLKFYDHQAITHNSLMITAPDGNEVFFKKGPFQTSGQELPIDTNEIVTLFENRNISDEYVLLKPGKYTIQFRAGHYGMDWDSRFPESNIVEFEVKQGIPAKDDLMISSLRHILPGKRWLIATQWEKTENVTPSGRKEVKGCFINLFCYAGSKRYISVTLWQTETPADIGKQAQTVSLSQYLGSNSWGYFYASIPPEAHEHWPNIKEDIIRTLKLNTDSKSSQP